MLTQQWRVNVASVKVESYVTETEDDRDDIFHWWNVNTWDPRVYHVRRSSEIHGELNEMI